MNAENGGVFALLVFFYLPEGDDSRVLNGVSLPLGAPESGVV